MIDGPYEWDKGRSVLHQAAHGDIEEGTVVAWNEPYVFVRFRGDIHSKACRRQDLEWILSPALPPQTEKSEGE